MRLLFVIIENLKLGGVEYDYKITQISARMCDVAGYDLQADHRSRGFCSPQLNTYDKRKYVATNL